MKGGRVLFEGSADLLEDEKNLRALFEIDVKLMKHPMPPKDYAALHKDPLQVSVVCE